MAQEPSKKWPKLVSRLKSSKTVSIRASGQIVGYAQTCSGAARKPSAIAPDATVASAKDGTEVLIVATELASFAGQAQT
jgi:hypothetical protein